MLNNDGPDVLRFLQRAMQLARQLNAEFGDTVLARNALNQAEYLVLRIVLLGYVHPRAIAERLQFSAPVVARAIAVLEQQGLVVVADDPDDRRRRTVRVTDAGRTLHDRVRAEAAAEFDERYPDLDPALVRAAAEALEALWTAIGSDEGYLDDPPRPRPPRVRGDAGGRTP